MNNRRKLVVQRKRRAYIKLTDYSSVSEESNYEIDDFPVTTVKTPDWAEDFVLDTKRVAFAKKVLGIWKEKGEENNEQHS